MMLGKPEKHRKPESPFILYSDSNCIFAGYPHFFGQTPTMFARKLVKKTHGSFRGFAKARSSEELQKWNWLAMERSTMLGKMLMAFNIAMV